MWKRKKTLALISCIALALLAFALLRPTLEPEPQYKGRPLRNWVITYAAATRGKKQAQRDQAAAAIRSIGSNAIPLLLAWTAYEAPPGRAQRLAELSRPLTWLNSQVGAEGSWALRDHEADLADAAMLAFIPLGPQARSAVAELATRLNAPKHTDPASRAAQSLALLPAFGLPLLAAALTNSEVPVRTRAAAAAAHLGTNSTALLPDLVRALSDPEWAVSFSAQRSLERLPEPTLALPFLLDALHGPNPSGRSAAAHVLGTMGRQALPAVPLLLDGLYDSDDNAQSDAYAALANIAPRTLINDVVFAKATNALASASPHLRAWGFLALRHFPPQARTHLPMLVTALGDTNWEVRASSLFTLATLGPDAASALPRIAPCLEDTNRIVRANATNALRQIAPAR